MQKELGLLADGSGEKKNEVEIGTNHQYIISVFFSGARNAKQSNNEKNIAKTNLFEKKTEKLSRSKMIETKSKTFQTKKNARVNIIVCNFSKNKISRENARA